MISEELALRMLNVLKEFDDTLEATGGLVRDASESLWAPAVDPEWTDLGDVARKVKDILQRVEGQFGIKIKGTQPRIDLELKTEGV